MSWLQLIFDKTNHTINILILNIDYKERINLGNILKQFFDWQISLYIYVCVSYQKSH